VLDDGNHVIGQYDGDGGSGERGFAGRRDTAVRMGVPIPIGTVPGTYRVVVGLYEGETGERFVSEQGDTLTVGTVEVVAPPVPPPVEAISLPAGRFFDERAGSLALVAARINKLGSDHAPDVPLRPGEPLSVLLYWQIREPRAVFPRLPLRLVDLAGHTLGEWELTPTDGQYPVDQWRIADLIRDPHTVFLPGDLEAGSYNLVLVPDGRNVLLRALTIVP
jgi:hypothetical protein